MQHYPFSAVLGCDAESLDGMGLSLILTTISPEIGGVLVRGEKGTAKSTAVRALAPILPPIQVHAEDRFSIDPSDPDAVSPDGPFGPDAEVITRPVRLVELPVGATEDRVLGSLHLESALAHGSVEYEPGLLARAHRGVLYVDEVNLLHDHLVDLLLDAAAMGRSTVERDGVSIEHAARFVLIGTMNPEEGELRPQLLDRFGLTVEVSAPRDPQQRVEVVRRRLAYDADPAAFIAEYDASEVALTERIAAARGRLPKVRLGDAALLKISEICAAFEVDGVRADIVTARAAVAHAAWEGREEVTRADIRQAALLSLPHRRRRNPFDAPGLDEDLLDQILGDDEPEPDPPEDPPVPESESEPEPTEADPSTSDSPEESQGPEPDPASASAESDGSPTDEPPMEQPRAGMVGRPEPRVSAAPPYRPKLLTVAGLGEGAAGRRSKAISSIGRRVGAKLPDGSGGSLHLVETLFAAAGRPEAHAGGGRLQFAPADLRLAVREGREANLVLFCVDASGSMAARKRMSQVKAAVLSLLLDAYRRRDKVGLITFRGQTAELTLPPTRSVEAAAARLDDLPAGGRTPLAEGLLEAAEVILRERLRDPSLRALLVVVTDGRANHGPDPVAQSMEAAAYVRSLGVTTVVIDSENGPVRMGLARKLAVQMGAKHLPVAEVNATALTDAVSDHISSRKGVA
jgi:magnesium chelatase subunit D